jgi:hypothetical protein
MGPHLQWAGSGLGHPGHQGSTVAASAVHRVYDEFGLRLLGLAHLDVGVAHQYAVGLPDRQVRGAGVATVPQLEDDVLGERVGPIGVASRAGQYQNVAYLIGVQPIDPFHGRGLFRRGAHPPTVAGDPR